MKPLEKEFALCLDVQIWDNLSIKDDLLRVYKYVLQLNTILAFTILVTFLGIDIGSK